MSTLRLVPGTPDAVLSALTAVLDGSGTPFAPLPADPAAAERVRQAVAPDEPLESDDCAVILTTSGSSGEPKGVMLSRSALLASATATHHRLGGPGQWLLPMQPYFVGGLQVLTRSVLAGFAPVVSADHPGFAEAVAALTGPRKYSAMVPTQLARYLDTELDALLSFDAIVIGGASMPADLKARARAAGVTAVPAYGMTETGSGCVYAGEPLAGTSLRLEDERILISGPTLFSGYRLRPQLTAEVFHDRWFRTQDRGRFVDGRLQVIGRLDDVVISGGVNITLTAVQARLLEHPGVSDAVVLGVPDPEWGSRVVAFVVGRPGGGEPGRNEPGRDELRDFVAEVLPRTWAPRDVVRLAALPMLASGKVDRQGLLEGVAR
ncbi:O-succinylbenzoic acid--CoA ligase [Kribbella orskensis]|uniref:O-succinylbenzoic acid--CoA ligase n=1 Tax=Kribbella orskensis TaxID=2512216 RepID=A0ABY2BKW3_9ACTN|nr:MULTISPECIES: o-succinylbenzoate--CoA ligase [Kribbella]TCN40417.1 O-succinylbenzoic acid--CoA ligase [Kribbella sp. VKM Ac-2500]TCO23037.1 O-succinylbenzoic acid--CoA ligase [Kribbella orskensis]